MFTAAENIRLSKFNRHRSQNSPANALECPTAHHLPKCLREPVSGTFTLYRRLGGLGNPEIQN